MNGFLLQEALFAFLITTMICTLIIGTIETYGRLRYEVSRTIEIEWIHID